jgi:hypothetical protein
MTLSHGENSGSIPLGSTTPPPMWIIRTSLAGKLKPIPFEPISRLRRSRSAAHGAGSAFRNSPNSAQIALVPRAVAGRCAKSRF